MSKELKKDIFGKTPKVGDTLIFNPPKYKGLCYGACTGFRESLPLIQQCNVENFYIEWIINKSKDLTYSIKTDFAIK